MRIVIVGDGKVGHTLMKQLSQEGHDIVIIDKNMEVDRMKKNKLYNKLKTGLYIIQESE